MTNSHFILTSSSSLWWLGLFGSILICLLVLYLGFYFKSRYKEEKFRQILVYLLLTREIIFYLYIAYYGKFNYVDSLPLHLCGLSYILAIIFLYKPNFILFEFLLLLSIGGAVQSINTPEITHGYSPYLLFDYYISHSAIIFTPFYAYFVLGFRLRDFSWFKTWIAAHIVLISVGVVNWLMHSNYIYLCDPPKVDNPLVQGAFPYHLIGFEIFGTIHILLFYFIFKKIIPLTLKKVNI